MNNKNNSGLILGILLVSLGSSLLINQYFVISYYFWIVISKYWPIGLIVSGGLLIFKQRLMALLVLMIVLCLFLISKVAHLL